MFMDFILNGQGQGEVGEALANCRFDPGLLRPYVDSKGRKCVTLNTGRMQFNKETKRMEPVYEKHTVASLMNNGVYSPVFNAATSLRKDEWLQLDQVVIRAARRRLRAWADLAGANSFGGFNGMAKMILEHETMSDPGEAVVDMDGLTDGRTDSPKYQLEGVPLPITHSDFYFSSRRLLVSRNTGTPLDTTMGEAAGRRVAETVEKTLIGTLAGVTYGKAADYGRAPTVYGYTNFPDRITKTDFTAPTAGGWVPNTLYNEVLGALESLYDANYYGPFMLYHSRDWSQYMNRVFSDSGGNHPGETTRTMLMKIDGLQDVRRLDFLDNTFTLLLVQMTSDVARAINGMDITTVQWESQGGMRVNFKVMSIMVPQLRADFNGNTGILHGTTA